MSTALQPGTRIGVYEIIAAIGAGGMGEVYRAHDTRLGRDVAIKILPEAFARDPDRLARFEREARTLASLNHPNIAQVYGFEARALVMELLDGETLRDRLRDGAIPQRKAIEYAAQIARGLAAAHDRGIVHRDLKPENVFVLRDGHVKILDFGLARQVSRPGSEVSGTAATLAMTSAGTVLGTVGYMAPEQVRGGDVDARTDLFALGAVLHELLTGVPAFKRDTAAETMTAILKEDPQDLAASRAEVNPALDRIVRHCLEKNPIERFQTARDVAFALDSLSGATSAAVSGATAVVAAPRPRRSAERWVWMAATLALAATAAWLGLTLRNQPSATATVAYRTILPLPENVSINTSPIAPLRLGICPDGRRVAFVGFTPQRQSTIWIQSLSDADTHELKGTAALMGPTWAADCARLVISGGSAAGFAAKLVDATGAGTLDLGPIGYGIWGSGGDLVATTGAPEWTIRHIPQPGAAPTVLLKPSASTSESFIAFSFLPDGRHFLLYHQMGQGNPRLEMASLDGGERPVLLEYPDLGNAYYASGAIVFARADRVFAQPFDLRRMRLAGQATLLADRVDTTPRFGAAFAVSANGVLVYSGHGEVNSRLTWMDRAGRVLSTVADDADYSNLELSPDGRRLAVSVADPSNGARDIYIVDLERNVRQRLTFDPSDERSAVWSPDGRQIIYNSKGLDLYRRLSDFTGVEEPIETDHASKDPRQVSPDGRLLLFRRSGGATRNDTWIMPLDGDLKPEPLLQTPFDENYASFSPDGRSVVYESDESGHPEVYVISRDAGGGKSQVSTGGGSFPRWRRDGKEILYLSPDQTLMSVPVSESGSAFKAGTPAPLFRIANVQGGAGTPFDVTRDGQRVIVNTNVASRLPPHLNVIVNWPALLH